MSTTLTVIISAATGTLVSGILTIVGQALERRARRAELLLSKALVRLGREKVHKTIKFQAAINCA